MPDPERRVISITVEQLEELADKSACKASEETIKKMKSEFFVSIGQGVFSKLIYLVGVGLVWLWWNMEGIKLPFGK